MSSHRQTASHNSYSNGGRVEAYTDGACKNNNTYSGRSGGVGVNFPGNPEWNISRPLTSNPVNNQRAELEAANDAMQRARDNGVDKLTVYSDSKYVVDGSNSWSKNWEQNGYKTASGGDVKHQDLWREMQDHKRHMDVEIKHVPGHSGNEHNDKADRLANEGAAKSSYY